VELSVIGVSMASDAMGRDDVSDWAAIHGEQRRTVVTLDFMMTHKCVLCVLRSLNKLNEFQLLVHFSVIVGVS